MLAQHLLKSGTGSPIVFLHGFLGTAADWTSVVPFLSHPCIGFDLPGHGASPFTLDWEQSLLNVGPVHLVGYSMGGRLALQFAQKHKVLSLTLVSAHLGLKTEAEKQARKKQERMWLEKLKVLPIDEFVKQWYDQPLFNTLSKVFLKMRQKQNRAGLLSAFEAFALSKQPRLPLPPNTKLICGEFDETYRAHYTHRPHLVIPKSGHAIHLENPHALAEALHV